MIKNILVLGTDMRLVTAANTLCKLGYCVSVFGFGENAVFSKSILRVQSLKTSVENADMIVCPMPLSSDEITIRTPLCDKKIFIHEIFKMMKKTAVFVGGKISTEIFNTAKTYNIKITDYLMREELAVLNAVATAEGALQCVIANTDITIHGSNCLVTGFGRLGKTISKTLYSLGANTFVSVRNKEDLAWIKVYGYKGVYLSQLDEAVKEADICINTVPHKIFTENILKEMKKDAVIIDLASPPGGVDFKKADELGIKAIHALSLPGKTAPVTAGKLIAKTINNIIKESEVQNA